MANPDRAAAVARYRETHDALHEYSAGITEEDETYLNFNQQAGEAAKDPNLPWYLRSR